MFKKVFFLILILATLASLILQGRSDLPTKKIFLDITDQAGIKVIEQNHGISWGDFDNDGYDDLFVSNMTSPSKLFKNLGNNTFANVTANVGIKEYRASSAVFADVNNDGWLDILIVSQDSKNDLPKSMLESNKGHLALYINGGVGVFENKSAEWGLSGIEIDEKGAVAFSDIDNDGWLDFLVSVHGSGGWYSYPTYGKRRTNDEDIISHISQIEGRKPSHVQVEKKLGDNKVLARFPGEVMLFQNTSKGKFTNISTKLPKLDTSSKKFFQPIFFDWDGDNLPDLFLAVDFDRPFMLKNTGQFNFIDVTKPSGLLKRGNWMGADVGDFNNDGKLDLYVTNVRGDLLAENIGREFKIKAKFNRESIGWGAIFIDYDNDGWQDIFVCNGDEGRTRFILENLGEIPWEDFTRENKLYRNLKEEFIFIRVEGEVNDDQSCKGAASSDFDNNGFPDIFVANEILNILPNTRGSILYKNTGNSNSWIKIKLKGTKSNKFGVGAKIQVSNGGLTQTKVVTAGNSYYSQSSYEQIFGFGDFKDPVDITVFWPSGIVQHLNTGQFNRRLIIEEK